MTKFTYLQSLLVGEAKACVEGLSLTDANYKEAKRLLTERFGRKESIIFAHLQALLTLPVPSTSEGNLDRASQLRKLYDVLQGHIRSLASLGVGGDQYGVVLTPVLLSRLPADIRLEWLRNATGKEDQLNDLLKFLREEVERRECCESYASSSSSASSKKKDERRNRPATTAALHAGDQPTCGICDKNHNTSKCWQLTRVTPEERNARVRKAGLCLYCLQKGHFVRQCPHKESETPAPMTGAPQPGPIVPALATSSAASSSSRQTVLQTAKVTIIAPDSRFVPQPCWTAAPTNHM